MHKKHNYAFINDKSYYFNKQLPTLSQESKFSNCLVKLLSFLPLILPSKKWKILFDCWQAMLICMRMFIQSVRVGFCLFTLRECVDVFTNEILIIMLVSFIFEMIINFNTGYFKKGVIIVERKKIVKHYLRNAFVPDILAQIPLIYNLFTSYESSDTVLIIGYILEFLVFLQYVSLTDVFKRLERVLTINETMAKIYPLIHLIFDIIIIAHFIAISFHLVAMIELKYGESETWISKQNLQGSDVTNLYIFSLYWSISTMVTILLFIPDTQAEKIFMIFAIMVTCGMFAYAINTIGIILQDIHKKTTTFKSERAKINRFLNKKKLNQGLKERIQNYIDYLHQQEGNSYQDENDVITKRLSPELAVEVSTAIYKSTMKEFSILSDNFSSYVQKQCMTLIEEIFLTSGEYVFKENDSKENYIYLLQNGVVQIYNKYADAQINSYQNQNNREIGKLTQEFQQFINQKNNYQTNNFDEEDEQDESVKKVQNNQQFSQQIYLQKIKPGQQFGFSEFFTGNFRQYSAKCIEPCQLLRINREKFIKIIKSQDKDFENFCMIRDCLKQRIYKHQLLTKFKFMNCLICQSQHHEFVNCSEVQFLPSTKHIIYDYNKLMIQFRFKKKRRELRFKVLNYLDEIQDGLKQLYEDEDLTETLQEKIDFYHQCVFNYEIWQKNYQLPSNNNNNQNGYESLSNMEQLNVKNTIQNQQINLSINNNNSQYSKSSVNQMSKQYLQNNTPINLNSSVKKKGIAKTKVQKRLLTKKCISRQQSDASLDGDCEISDKIMNEYETPRLFIKKQQYQNNQQQQQNQFLINGYFQHSDIYQYKLSKSDLSSFSSSSSYSNNNIQQSVTNQKSQIGSLVEFQDEIQNNQDKNQQFKKCKTNLTNSQMIAEEKRDTFDGDYQNNKVLNIRRRRSQLNPNLLLQITKRKQTFIQQPQQFIRQNGSLPLMNNQSHFYFQNQFGNTQSQQQLPMFISNNNNPTFLKRHSSVSPTFQFNQLLPQNQKIALHLLPQQIENSSQIGSQKNISNKKDTNLKQMKETYSREISNLQSFPQQNSDIQQLQQQLKEIEWDLQFFDKILNYKYYFPYNNYEQIINSFKKRYDKRKAILIPANTFYIKKKEISDNIKNRKSNIKNNEEPQFLNLAEKISNDKYPARRASRQRYLEYQKLKRGSEQNLKNQNPNQDISQNQIKKLFFKGESDNQLKQ